MVTSSGDGDGDGLALLLVHVPKHDLPLAGVFTNEAKMTGENLNIRKNFNDPFVLSGTEVVDGEGVFLAIAVGKYSEWGIIMSKVVQERDPTPLQVKLERMAAVIGCRTIAIIICISFPNIHVFVVFVAMIKPLTLFGFRGRRCSCNCSVCSESYCRGNQG